MAVSSVKGGINVGPITCSLPILVLIAATLGLFLGFVVTPWLGLPLRSTIQSYIWNAGFEDLEKNARFTSNFGNLTDNHIAAANSPGKIDDKVEQYEGVPILSVAEPNQKEQNEGMKQDDPVKPFPHGDTVSTSTNFSSNPSDKHFESNGTQFASGSPGDLQDKSANTDKISANGHQTEQMTLPPSTISESGTARIVPPATTLGFNAG